MRKQRSSTFVGLAATSLLIAAGASLKADDAVLFCSDRSGVLQLYRVDANGGAVTQLTRTGRDETQPAVSPDGSRLAWCSSTGAKRFIMVMNAGGGDAVTLTSSGGDEQPHWSPDSTRIVFVSRRDGDRAIHVMNADGSDQRRLSRPGPPAASDRSPRWSPDGTRIAFSARIGGDEELFVMNADGSGRRRLTTHAGRDTDPSWSPDGRTLVFASSDAGRSDEIVRIGVDGTGRRSLIDRSVLSRQYVDRNVSSWGPRWSPDGTRVVFVSIRSGNAELYVMRPYGGGVRPLTDDPDQDLMPAWSLRSAP